VLIFEHPAYCRTLTLLSWEVGLNRRRYGCRRTKREVSSIAIQYVTFRDGVGVVISPGNAAVPVRYLQWAGF